MGPETVIALGAVQAGLTAAGAIKQNQAVKRSLRSSAEAAASNAAQIRDSSRLESSKVERQAAQARARAKVLLAASGRGLDTSGLDILTQATADEAFNLSVIDTNAMSAGRSVASGAAAQQAQIASQYQNPILASLQGALAGIQSGLLINQGFQGLTATTPSTPVLPQSQTEVFNWMQGAPIVRP